MATVLIKDQMIDFISGGKESDVSTGSPVNPLSKGEYTVCGVLMGIRLGLDGPVHWDQGARSVMKPIRLYSLPSMP